MTICFTRWANTEPIADDGFYIVDAQVASDDIIVDASHVLMPHIRVEQRLLLVRMHAFHARAGHGLGSSITQGVQRHRQA
jgi:hypothetical protein